MVQKEEKGKGKQSRQTEKKKKNALHHYWDEVRQKQDSDVFLSCYGYFLTTLMCFHCRTGSGFLSTLKFLQMDRMHFPGTKNTKRQSCPLSLPWSCLLFLGWAFGKWGISRNSDGKYRRMGEGWSQGLSVWHVQAAQSLKIWFQNSPYQILYFQKDM